MSHELQNRNDPFLAAVNRPDIRVPKTIQAVQRLIIWRKNHAEAPDYWLRAVICQAFERMVVRRMPDAPVADLIEVVAEDWIDIIGEGMNQDQDLERVVIGLRRIFRECGRWPQPVDLLKRLPRRQPARADAAAPAQPTAEDHARQAAELQKILDSLK